MNIKNYTSGVAAESSVARIEKLLVEIGASMIVKEYDPKGNIEALMFKLSLPLGIGEAQGIAIRLPANIDGCLDALWDIYRKTHSRAYLKNRDELREQATRTAWKLQLDWVEVNISLIRLRQQEPLQTFLPYVWNGKQTFYSKLQTTNFAQLLPPKGD